MINRPSGRADNDGDEDEEEDLRDDAAELVGDREVAGVRQRNGAEAGVGEQDGRVTVKAGCDVVLCRTDSEVDGEQVPVEEEGDSTVAIVDRRPCTTVDRLVQDQATVIDGRGA